MKTTLACTLGSVVLLLPFAASRAEVSLSTDKNHYEVGEVVHISIHNSGPENLYFSSYPFVVAATTNPPQCVYGCVGLPVVTDFPADTTAEDSWDTGIGEVPPGEYRIAPSITGVDVSTTIHLHEKLGSGDPTWSMVKGQYR
jgi:hypothetical protein